MVCGVWCVVVFGGGVWVCVCVGVGVWVVGVCRESDQHGTAHHAACARLYGTERCLHLVQTGVEVPYLNLNLILLHLLVEHGVGPLLQLVLKT